MDEWIETCVIECEFICKLGLAASSSVPAVSVCGQAASWHGVDEYNRPLIAQL